MGKRVKLSWYEVSGTATLNCGPFSVYIYEDKEATRTNNGRLTLRFKVGSFTSEARYHGMTAAKKAALRHIEKVCKEVLEQISTLAEFDAIQSEREAKEKLDSWHLGILGLSEKQ